MEDAVLLIYRRIGAVPRWNGLEHLFQMPFRFMFLIKPKMMEPNDNWN